MKLVKKASGYALRLTKSEYFEIGKKLGFTKQAQDVIEDEGAGEADAVKYCEGIDPNAALEKTGPTGGIIPPKVFLVTRGEGMRYLIRKFKTKFYNVLARKRDGSIRIFESLMGYKKGYDYAPYDPVKKQQSQEQQLGTGTIKVWDRKKNGWSTIIVDNIEVLKGIGNVYIVTDPTIGPVVDLVDEIEINQKGPQDIQQLNAPPLPVEEIPTVKETPPATVAPIPPTSGIVEKPANL